MRRNGPACGCRHCLTRPASSRARWVIAEGADAAAMSRSVPLAKAMDDALVCLYQNGERVRPSNGYPVRLLLPGFEGNMNVKWLRRLKLTAAPAMTKDETSKYTDPAQGRESLAVRVPDGGEVRHHPRPSPGLDAERAGLLRDLRSRLVGQRQHPAGRRIGRRRAELGAAALQARSCRWRRCASARLGNGTAARRCCKAAPPTTPAWCSRRARSSPPNAACAASITTTPSPAGASTRRGGDQCLCLKRLAICGDLSPASWRCGAAARSPRSFGQPIAPADLRPGTSASDPTAPVFHPGGGTVAQGEAVYASQCQACHGEKGPAGPTIRWSAE